MAQMRRHTIIGDERCSPPAAAAVAPLVRAQATSAGRRGYPDAAHPRWGGTEHDSRAARIVAACDATTRERPTASTAAR